MILNGANLARNLNKHHKDCVFAMFCVFYSISKWRNIFPPQKIDLGYPVVFRPE